MKKLISLLLAALTAVSLASFTITASAADSSFAQQLRKAGFPSAYVTKLTALHEKYPNWDFEPLFTGVTLEEAVANERTPHSQQLIQKTSSNSSKNYYCSCSSCYRNGNYVIQEGSTWVSASESAVEYYMNPLNFLDEKYIFQFETTAYSPEQTISGIETIIKNTWMYNSIITYKDSGGTTRTFTGSAYPNGVKYSQAILDAAKQSGMSAYYLASRIVQEVGGRTNSAGGASGTNATYPGIYNYYNIGANSGALDGLRWASTGSGYSTNCRANLRSNATTNSSIITTIPDGTSVNVLSTTGVQPDGYKWYRVSVTVNSHSYTGYIRSDLVDYSSSDKYHRPWTNPYVSIVNGAKYIANNFSADQNTGYLQKFNVNPESDNMYSHEYMANVQAPSSEAGNTYKAYSSAGLLSGSKTFVIPVFEGMEEGITGLRVTSRGGDGERLRIDWDAVDGATKYQIYDITNGKNELKATTSNNYYLFTDLTPGWTYEIIIYANDEDKSSSEPFMFGAACPKVQNLTAKLTGRNTIQAKWDATTSHGYYLEWSTTSDFSKDVNSAFIGGTNNTSYTIKTAKPANQYYIRARAYKVFELGGTIYGAFSQTLDLTDRLLPADGIKVTARGGDGERAKIEWNAVDGAVKYEVYEITNGVNRLKGTTTATNFTFTDLVPGWTYEIKVAAYNDDGDSSESEGYTFGAACPTVQNLKATITGMHSIQAEWDVTTSHGYRLEWSTTSDFSKDVNGTYISGTNSTSYTIKTEKPADQYYVRVRAYKLFNGSTIYGAFSKPVSLAGQLLPVTGVTITARGGDGERARIDWNAVNGAVRYEVYEITNGVNRLKGETTATNFTFTDLVPGWTYEVKVVAYSADGESSESEGYTFGAACPTVQNLKASVTDTNTIEAQWDVTTSHGYRLEWSTSADFSKDVNGTYISGTNSTSYTIKTEKPADQYYVRVRAYKLFQDTTIYGAFTQPIDIMGIEITARGGDGERARIDWNDAEDAVRYEVYEITNGINRLKGNTIDPYFTFTDLVPGWTYEVKVVAYNADDEELFESEGYTFGAACPTVQNLKASVTGTNTIEAQWDVTTSHGYRLEWSTSADFSKDVNGTYISGTNSTSYTIKTEKPADQYYVRVRAYKLFNDSTIYGAFTQPVGMNNII